MAASIETHTAVIEPRFPPSEAWSAQESLGLHTNAMRLTPNLWVINIHSSMGRRVRDSTDAAATTHQT